MALPRLMNMAEQEAAFAYSAKQEARSAQLATTVENLLDAYRAKYRNEGKGGVRANAPLQKEVGELAAAFNAYRTRS